MIKMSYTAFKKLCVCTAYVWVGTNQKCWKSFLSIKSVLSVATICYLNYRYLLLIYSEQYSAESRRDVVKTNCILIQLTMTQRETKKHKYHLYRVLSRGPKGCKQVCEGGKQFLLEEA